MSMELRLQEIININNILKSIIDDSNLKIDVCLKFELLSIMKEFQSFVLNYNTICNEKIIEYGEKTKNDNFQISIKNNYMWLVSLILKKIHSFLIYSYIVLQHIMLKHLLLERSLLERLDLTC